MNRRKFLGWFSSIAMALVFGFKEFFSLSKQYETAVQETFSCADKILETDPDNLTGEESKVIMTGNGGATWQEIDLPNLPESDFIVIGYVMVLTHEGRGYMSKDLGTTFKQVAFPDNKKRRKDEV